MNLREANVMRAQMAEMRAIIAAIENRLKLLEDSLARINQPQERAHDGRRAGRSNIKSGAFG